MNETLPTEVLLATDGSADATQAARVSADLSRRTGARLHVVHAWQPLPRGTPPGDYWEYAYSGSERSAKVVLEGQMAIIEKAGARVDAAYLKEGSPAEQILDVADEIGAGVIVIGRRGLGALGRLVLGSVSERIVHMRRARCSSSAVVKGCGRPKESWSATTAPGERRAPASSRHGSPNSWRCA
jgi:nucleotide-binding universal stress UspA family protein